MASVTYESHYVTMRDGVRIAIDVWRPRFTDARLPTILRQTRYFRSARLRRPLRWFNGNRPIDISRLYATTRRLFLRAGYAWVDVDVRGSGASSGFCIGPWTQPEIGDAIELVDWIISQPWSNGTLGAQGISYDGTAAEMLLTTGHPAVKAIAPRFSSSQSFGDVGFPGGMLNVGFIRRWNRLNTALDANRLQDIAGRYVISLTDGVTPVQSDRDGSQRDAAIAEHSGNYSVLERTREIRFADDRVIDPRVPEVPIIGDRGERLHGSQLTSPALQSNRIIHSGAAIYSTSGWWDGAYARVAALRFHRVPSTENRLLLGPWNHGGGSQYVPGQPCRPHDFDFDQNLLDFFDLHLRGRANRLAGEPLVRYFTMNRRSNQSAWNFSSTWPPTNHHKRILFLEGHGQLVADCPSRDSCSHYLRQPATTGSRNRWQTQSMRNGTIDYPDRRQANAGLLCFRSRALDTDIEVTGHPIARLNVACDADDGAVFVYLEDVGSAGQVWLVTEGLLRLSHGRLATVGNDPDSQAHQRLGLPFRTWTRDQSQPMPAAKPIALPGATRFQHIIIDLLPTSYVFRQNHVIQLSIAMTDVGNFEPTGANQLWVSHGDTGDASASASRLELPVCG